MNSNSYNSQLKKPCSISAELSKSYASLYRERESWFLFARGINRTLDGIYVSFQLINPAPEEETTSETESDSSIDTVGRQLHPTGTQQHHQHNYLHF